MRIIQVGMAAWGQTWIPIVRQSREAMPVGYVDPDPVTLATIQAQIGIPTTACFQSLDAALAAIDADAVLVTAAVPAHVPVALAALAAGKHVLLEKPFATTLTEAERVVAAADAAQRTLMISQNYRFYPAPRTVRALVQGNVLGPVGSITIDFRRNAAALPPEHALSCMAQPLLAEMAVHHLDLLRMILGDEAALVSCQSWSPIWSNLAGPAAAAATITSVGGTVISYRGDWASHARPTPWAGVWRMECSEGEIVWTSRNGRDAGDDLVIVRRRGHPPRRVVLPQLQLIGRAACLAAFIRAVQTGRQPECSGRDNLGTVALMESTIAAAHAGQPVALPTPPISLPWSYRITDWTSRIRAGSASQPA